MAALPWEALLLCLLRPGLVVLLLPLGALRLRLLLAAGVAILFSPALLAPAAALPGGPALLSILAREALVGAALGLILAVPLAAARATGEIVDQMMSGQGGVGALYAAVAALLFVQLGGPEAGLRALGRSYELVPIGALPLPGAIPILVALPGRLFAAALLLAAHPVLVLLCAQGLCALCQRACAASAGQGAAAASLAAVTAMALGLAGALPVLTRLLLRLPWELGWVLSGR